MYQEDVNMMFVFQFLPSFSFGKSIAMDLSSSLLNAIDFLKKSKVLMPIEQTILAVQILIHYTDVDSLQEKGMF